MGRIRQVRGQVRSVLRRCIVGGFIMLSWTESVKRPSDFDFDGNSRRAAGVSPMAITLENRDGPSDRRPVQDFAASVPDSLAIESRSRSLWRRLATLRSFFGSGIGRECAKLWRDALAGSRDDRHDVLEGGRM